MWGLRVVIPVKLQHRLLVDLHECHRGMCKMKALSRAYVWWPNIDEEIEEMVRECVDCVNASNNPQRAPLVVWPWAKNPWQRIHIDYLEVNNQMFLLVVDSYSKWLEVFPMTSTTASATIRCYSFCFLDMDIHNMWCRIMDHNLLQMNLKHF